MLVDAGKQTRTQTVASRMGMHFCFLVCCIIKHMLLKKVRIKILIVKFCDVINFVYLNVVINFILRLYKMVTMADFGGSAKNKIALRTPLLYSDFLL